jgi:predicted nucleotidyltransferase
MKISGIVAEYNPFHAGHAWHIAQTRAVGATHIVAVMSGCTVQRGAFAIASKQARARMALAGGADLVLCLPTPWSCARAQDFSRAALWILHNFGCIDLLSFGSECGNAALLQRAAVLLREGSVQNALHRGVGEGASFARARQAALAQADPALARILRCPNDTLGVEYCLSTAALGACWEVLAVPRRGAGHDEIGATAYPSASELRIIFQNRGVPQEDFSGILAAESAANRAPVDMKKLETAWLSRLRCMSVEEIACLPDISEGLEHRLHRAIRQGNSVAEILHMATGKRVPTARVRRILFHAFVGVRAAHVAALPRFIQVIGHNAKGREILKKAKTTAALPVVLRTADLTQSVDYQAREQFATECRAADLMALAMPGVQPCGQEERREVVVMQ